VLPYTKNGILIQHSHGDTICCPRQNAHFFCTFKIIFPAGKKHSWPQFL
jgi:hypothetical protein